MRRSAVCSRRSSRWCSLPRAAAVAAAAPRRPRDPVAQVPSGAAGEGARGARPAAVGVPGDRRQDAAGARRRRSAAARRWGSPARSSSPAGENRVAFGVIDQNAGFLYGKTALYVAPHAGRAGARARTSAPADVLVTEPPYRSQQAATEGDPFAAVYAAQVPFAQAGHLLRAGRHARRRQAGRRAEPDQGRHAAQDKVPDVGEQAPKVADRHGRLRGRRRRGDRHAAPDERHARRSSPTSSARSPSRCCSRRRSCASRASAARSSTRRCSCARATATRWTSSTRRSTTDNDPNKGLRKPLQEFNLPTRAVAVRRRQGREDHRAARGLVRPRRVRAGAQDRAVSAPRAARGPRRGRGRRRRCSRRTAAQAHGLVQRTNLPIPEWCSRGRRRSCWWPRSRGWPLLWPTPAAAGAAAGGRCPAGSGACSAAGPSRSLCAAIGVALLGVVIVRRLRGRRLGARQPRADVHPDRLLGRARVRERAVRRRVPRVQPVARDPARRASGPIPSAGAASRPRSRCSASPGSSSSRAGASTPADLDDRRGRLHRLHARDAGRLRDRGVDPPRRGVRGLLQPVLAHVASGRRATASSACGRRSAGCRGSTRCRAPSLFVAVMIGTVTFDGFSQGAALEGLLGRPRRRDRRARRARRRAEGRRHARAARRRRARSARFYRLGIDGARSVGGDLDAARAAARVHPHARADRDGLRRGALPHVPAVRGPGDFYLASDPLGQGWDLFGTASRAIDYTYLSQNATWYLQVGVRRASATSRR